VDFVQPMCNFFHSYRPAKMETPPSRQAGAE
jgi:hypothetical protein